VIEVKLSKFDQVYGKEQFTMSNENNEIHV